MGKKKGLNHEEWFKHDHKLLLNQSITIFRDEQTEC